MAITTSKIGEIVEAQAVRELCLAGVADLLGDDWTQARFALFFTGIDHLDENAQATLGTETITVGSVADMIAIGLKDDSVLTLPGEAGSSFIGLTSGPTNSKATTAQFADASGNLLAGGYTGATPVGFSGGIENGALQFPDASGVTGFNGFYALNFTVNNRDLASQSVSISVARSALIAGVDYTKPKIKNLIASASFGAAKTFAWNTGSAAKALPDHFYYRLPFLNHRIRVHSMFASKLLP